MTDEIGRKKINKKDDNLKHNKHLSDDLNYSVYDHYEPVSIDVMGNVFFSLLFFILVNEKKRKKKRTPPVPFSSILLLLRLPPFLLSITGSLPTSTRPLYPPYVLLHRMSDFWVHVSTSVDIP